jgi:hypothetical protein
MSFRFITKSIHAYVIDYPFAIVLLAAPFVLKLGQSGPVATWLSVVVGVAALLLPALTDHPTGLVRIKVLFLSDIFLTGYMGAEFCNIRNDDTIAVWGCGPVGQFAIRSAFLLGAGRVIAIDTVPEGWPWPKRLAPRSSIS